MARLSLFWVICLFVQLQSMIINDIGFFHHEIVNGCIQLELNICRIIVGRKTFCAQDFSLLRHVFDICHDHHNILTDVFYDTSASSCESVVLEYLYSFTPISTLQVVDGFELGIKFSNIYLLRFTVEHLSRFYHMRSQLARHYITPTHTLSCHSTQPSQPIPSSALVF
jgi:hypothetical protein